MAYQGGEAIFSLSASFAVPEEGISHQAPMPEVPDPESLPDQEVIMREAMELMKEEVKQMAVPPPVGASLDHSVWIHRPPRWDGWQFYENESPAGHAARALIHGAMYTRDGLRIASVAQEGLVRS